MGAKGILLSHLSPRVPQMEKSLARFALEGLIIIPSKSF